ncbi:MAG TPA: hypothetical protein VLE73_05755 [Candidatus Saccharimonadales bacterium]|nr:hypothetical protein [Candidatus Saccharimonadales bacterium]
MPEISEYQLRQFYPTFLQQAGRDLQLSTIEQRAVATADPKLWAYWAVSTLSGDERVACLEPSAAEGLHQHARQLFASEADINGKPVLDFSGGQLTRRVDTMYNRKNATVQQRFERVSKTLGEWTFTVGGAVGYDNKEWLAFVPAMPQVVVKPNSQGELGVEFKGRPQNRFALDGPSNTVITLGPGLTGADFATELIGNAQDVHLVSGGKSAHFLNGYINMRLRAVRAGIVLNRRAGTLQSQLPPGVDMQRAMLPEVHMYSDGIAATLGHLSTQETVADVVVMSAVHTAGTEECAAGITGAQKLLRPGGLLVIKAPDTSIGNEVGMDRVMPEATRAFGSPAAAGECGVFAERPDLPVAGDRPASYAIFRQQ